MAKTDSSKKPKRSKPKNASKSVEFNLDGNVDKSVIVVGDKATVNYYAAVSANIKPNDPDFWNLKHPYPMPPNFTGRIEERAMLTQWLDGDSENRLFILRALGGFGKSALTWQWLTHDVNPDKWKKVIFWSFYEGDAGFDHFAEETLKYLNREVSPSKRDQVDSLLHAMQAENILLIMDGFERALRAYSSMNAAYQGDDTQATPGGEDDAKSNEQYDCTDLNAEIFLRSVCSLPKIQSKVLMTTRLTPRAVKPRGEFMVGCCEVELTAMQKADAVEFFHKQGIQGNRVEIESACEPYGYHPLSLRLLAGRIIKDFEIPGDIVVAQKLKIDGDLIQQKHHVLEVSYNSLPKHEQKLLGTIACFRSPVEMKILESIAAGAKQKGFFARLFGSNPPAGARHVVPLQDQLHDLVDRGLLHFDRRTQKFDLHPIVRRYAYDSLTAIDKKGAHERLVNYFGAVPKPTNVKTLEDLASVIELYHHMVGAGNLDEAWMLFYDRLSKATYYQFGAYQLQMELLRALFLDGEDKPPLLKDESAQAWTLNGLANSYGASGQPRRAVPLLEMTNDIYENKMKNKQSLAIGLGNLANRHTDFGALSAAERNLRHQVNLCREMADEFREAVGRQDLGNDLSYRGAWQEAEQELSIAEKVFDKHGASQTNHVSVVRAYRALRFLLMTREQIISNQSPVDSVKSAIECAQRALELAGETARTIMNVPRDYVRAYWLLGSAYCMNDELNLAEENLSKALNLCRQINNVEHEANILLDVARLRYAQGDFKDALEKASDALVITERSGYVLQGADVHLFLAELAMNGHRLKVEGQGSDKEIAKFHAESALKLAYCDGGEYKYKVAYEEAERLLQTLNA